MFGILHYMIQAFSNPEVRGSKAAVMDMKSLNQITDNADLVIQTRPCSTDFTFPDLKKSMMRQRIHHLHLTPHAVIVMHTN
jgi:hypothetical protein